ncbi:MAG: HAD-IA family hydrolase [Pseudorhodoplanes sp.]
MIIFDCNGVLVDSEPIATRVVAEALRNIGIDIAPEAVARYFAGRRPADMFADIETASGVRLPAKFPMTVSGAILQRLQDELRPIPHVVHALTWLRGPKCVASSSSPERVRLSLEVTELDRFFGKNIFSANDVQQGKPAPDLFLHVSARMEVAAKDCLVVEDSPAGVTAAVAAGMTAIGFVGGSHAEPSLAKTLTDAGAAAVVTDMRALKSAVVDVRGY